MADNNKLELVVEVDVNKANASIKSINTGLSSMEQAAGKAARGASAGIDGLTVSMVKGSAAGNLLADSIKKALDWAKEWTLGAAQHAARTDIHLGHVLAGRQHGDDYLGAGHRLRDRRRDAAAGRRVRVHRRAHHIVAGHAVPRLQQVGGHRQPHVAQADE